jgi:hypothetical protein
LKCLLQAPCETPPEDPHGPCIPCRNAGRSTECGPRTLPGGRRAEKSQHTNIAAILFGDPGTLKKLRRLESRNMTENGSQPRTAVNGLQAETRLSKFHSSTNSHRDPGSGEPIVFRQHEDLKGETVVQTALSPTSGLEKHNRRLFDSSTPDILLKDTGQPTQTGLQYADMCQSGKRKVNPDAEHSYRPCIHHPHELFLVITYPCSVLASFLPYLIFE